ncbi:MAG TPA: hypothetical protein VET85_05820 [Stellaceae bacterium]|nr:hypothetical protein [Stellaceae bacterium]
MSRALRLREIAFLFAAPVAAWWAFGIDLINQNGYLDPWFYTGLGQIFPRLVELHGYTYYQTLRFPVIFLNALFCSHIDPVLGYALLRYALLLGCGAPLYLFARSRYGAGVAACAYLFLFCNPLLPRVLLWDLSTFVSVPTALAGMLVWLSGGAPRWPSRLAAGALFTLSLCAHLFTATAIACFLAVEVAATLLGEKRWRNLAIDAACLAAAGAAVIGLGILYGILRTGFFYPTLLWKMNVAAAFAAQDYTLRHAVPLSDWIAVATYAYVPPLLVLAAIALLRRRLFTLAIEARVTWFAALYVAFYAFDRFVLGGFVIEQFYYFAHLTIVVYLLVPIVIGAIADKAGRAASVALAAFAVVLILFPLANRLDVARAASFYDGWVGSLPMAAIYAALAAGFVAALAVPALRGRALLPLAVLGAALLQFPVFLSPPHRAVFDHRWIARERGVYRAAIGFTRVIDAYDRPGRRIITWYAPQGHPSLLAPVWSGTGFGDTLNDNFGAYGMPVLGDRERARLADTAYRYVLLLAESEREIDDGIAALAGMGAAGPKVFAATIGDEGYAAHVDLIEIKR